MLEKIFKARTKKHRCAIDFKKMLMQYKKLLIDNFDQRIGEMEDVAPVVEKLIKIFKESPTDLQIKLFGMVPLIGSPVKPYDNVRDNRRVNAWLQDHTSQMFDALEEVAE